jgi:hypothetical protein
LSFVYNKTVLTLKIALVLANWEGSDFCHMADLWGFLPWHYEPIAH